MARDLLAEAQVDCDRKGEKVRLFGEGLYGAESWERERRVVYKAKRYGRGPTPALW
jgi:hypothetical protein